MADHYVEDLGDIGSLLPMLEMYSQAFVSPKVERCFAILTDDKVRMGITVQHMVMQASTGRLEVQTP